MNHQNLLYILFCFFSFGLIIKWIISLFIDKEGHTSIEIILNSIGYFLVLFSSLIYNEIIIFNCFGLNGKTKK